ncbi:MAG: AmmeMemoRadiSam system radical SAM enzyme [Elusimicrobiota bacterium]|jgi:pyruvate formate lyase activating enzyme
MTQARGIGGALTSILALAVAGLCLAASALIARFPPPGTFTTLVSAENPWLREALFQRTDCNGVSCGLCPWQCFLPEGARGRCKVRMNVGGRLKTLVYGKPVSAHVDPIEKKPVFHMLPDSWIYSLATAGCNLHCTGCQNWEISQAFPEQSPEKTVIPSGIDIFPGPDGRLYGRVRQKEASFLSPQDIVDAALATRSKAVAYTYSEPAIFYEYMLDIAKLAHERGLRNVMVSGGYITPEALKALAPFMDVVKIDLKGFDEGFYRSFTGGELRFVLRTLTELKKLGVLTEAVNLVVPGLNDRTSDLQALCAWVHSSLGPDTPLFFSRFTPNYRLQNLPQTPEETLTRARDIALKQGLRYVYVGNVSGHPGENTFCPRCGRVLVRRSGFAVQEDLLAASKGRCPFDGTRIPGIWNDDDRRTIR